MSPTQQTPMQRDPAPVQRPQAEGPEWRQLDYAADGLVLRSAPKSES